MKIRVSAVLLGALATLSLSAASPAGSLAPGDVVPEFSVTDLNGHTRTRAELQKQAGESGLLMLTFWCTSCHSCREMERKLDKLAADYQGKVAVFALDSNAGETAAKIEAFKKARGLTLPAVLDPGAKVANLFGAKVTTTTLIIDRKGVLRYRGQFGRGERAFAQEALEALMAGKEVVVPTTQEFG